MVDCIRRIIALARIIVIDGLRRHALIGLILFALVGITGGFFFLDFIPRDIGRAVNDFLFSVMWLTGFIFLLFHAVQVMAWDNERGALHTFLARPISRTEYGLAIFSGLAVLLLALNIILGILSWVVLNTIKDSVAEIYFQHLSLLYFVIAGLGIFWTQLIILSVILLFSSVVRGSFSVLLLTLCYYFICSGLPVVRQALKQKDLPDSLQYLETLLKWLTAVFPDFSLLDFKTLAASNDPTPFVSDLLLTFACATLYIIVALFLSCSIYERRDLQ